MPLHPIIIPPKLVYNIEFCYNNIKDNEVSFPFPQIKIDNVVNNIKNNNNYNDSKLIIKNLYYFLYKYIIKDNPKEFLNIDDGGIPVGRLELKNKDSNKGFGIYHCHLSNIDKSILIWYPIINKKGYFMNLEYFKHPTNNKYDYLIKEIYYRNDDGYNLEIGEYFIDLKYLLPNKTFESKIIMKFQDFK